MFTRQPVTRSQSSSPSTCQRRLASLTTAYGTRTAAVRVRRYRNTAGLAPVVPGGPDPICQAGSAYKLADDVQSSDHVHSGLPA